MSNPSLTFVVVGASIAGLSCAYLLRQSEHDVVVVEKYPRDIRKDGGLRVPPNMTRLLQDLPGVEVLLSQKASKCSGVLFRQGESSRILGKMVLSQEILTDLGCDFHMISYADLHNHLYELCSRTGVKFKHNFEVKEVFSNTDTPRVVSKTGEKVSGDIVIGADGKNSVVRNVILSEDEDTDHESTDTSSSERWKPIFKEIIGASLSIPASSMLSDPELAPLTKSDEWSLWMGNGTSLSGAMYGRDLYVLALTYGAAPEPDAVDADWISERPLESVTQRTKEYEPRLQRLVRLAATSHWNVQTTHDLPTYVSRNNRTVLIGDAAHSVAINSTHNTAAAFEDAFTLGRLFAHIRSSSHIPLLLQGYVDIRLKRTRSIEKCDMESILLIGMLPGPARDSRDAGLAATLELESADDETLAQVWATYVSQFNYDSREEVDEWWLNWAKPIAYRSAQTNGKI